MSIQAEIERIKGNIAAAYEAIKAKGAGVPETQNSGSLAQAITDMPPLYTQCKGTSGRVTVSKQAGTIAVYPSKFAVEDGKVTLTLVLSGNATRSASFNGSGTVELRF